MKRILCLTIAGILVLCSVVTLCFRVEAETMTSSTALVDILKEREGYHQFPYWDNSHWSIGYGTECPDYEYYKVNGMTMEEAEAEFRKSLQVFETAVLNYAAKHGLTLSQNQFDALVSFSFNCGSSWMSGGAFSDAVRSGKGGSEFLYAICLWSTSGGEYVLMNRRLYEANMYLNAVYEKNYRPVEVTADVDGNGTIDKDDAIYLLRHVVYPEKYPLTVNCDVDKNVGINKDDAVYLLRHVVYPEKYTINTGSQGFKYVFLDAGAGEVRFLIHGYDTTDPIPVKAEFTKQPTGKDKDGNAFTYEFAGWYTSVDDGTKVEILDGSLDNGAVLHAKWRDPGGKEVFLPRGNACDPMKVTISDNVNVRSGPGTFYEKLSKLTTGTEVTLTRIYENGSARWGKTEDGWIKLSYTDYDAVLSGMQNWPKTGHVITNNVIVRNGPGTSNAKQYSLNEGSEVTIHEQTFVNGMYWGRLEDGNWISLTYVSFEANSVENPESTAPTESTEVTTLPNTTQTQ